MTVSWEFTALVPLVRAAGPMLQAALCLFAPFYAEQMRL